MISVLNELDELKKRSENARNVIRWLEAEFTHGNRFIRSQRVNENMQFTLLKIPRKLGKFIRNTRDQFQYFQNTFRSRIS